MSIRDILKLKKYLKLGCSKKEITKEEILGSNEALKQFAKLWGEHKADTMMMLTVIEYEFISNNNYTEEEIVAFKGALGKVGLFLRGCKGEWDVHKEAEERKKAH